MIIEKLAFNKHLEPGEKVLFIACRHWIRLIAPFMAIGFFGIIVPWSLYFMGFSKDGFLLIAVIWSALGVMQLFQTWLASFSNVWLFTDMSIISVQWRGPFSNLSQRVTYDDVEGLSYEVDGFGPTILRYGTVTLRLMSQANLELKYAMSPKKIEMELIRCTGLYHESREVRDAGALKTMLSEMVAMHLRNKIN